MKKVKFTQKQPLLKTFDSGDGIYVFICANEKEITEEIQQGNISEESQSHTETVYEYDCNEFVTSADRLPDIEQKPKKYLDYVPETKKSTEQLLTEKSEQITAQAKQIEMLKECLLEMSEQVYA